MTAGERIRATRPRAVAAPETPAGGIDEPALAFACPRCGDLLARPAPGELTCTGDGLIFQRKAGIWGLVAPEREACFAAFLREYDTVRRAEGRGADDERYYRALPFSDLSGRMPADWKIRARSYEALIDRVIEPLERRSDSPLTVLDIGAGNCWLSNRLAGRGHTVAAIDLRVDALDGLGAHRHYLTSFTPVQAEYDRLPFASGMADLAIFNASIHYSPDYRATLQEALRVLSPAGHIVILDSPVYRDPASGQAMVREREAQFVERYGFASNALPSENFLTYRRLDELGDALGLRWRMHRPFYGLVWAARPWKARLLRRREPAQFLVIDGRRETGAYGAAGRRRHTAGRFVARWRYRLTQRHRYRRLVLEEAAGRPVLVLPQVFNPALFRSGEFLAGILDEQLIPPGSTVLDMGCGSGVIGIAAARWARRVVAVDINPEAVRCTRINAMLNRVEDRVEVREGDLYAPVHGDRFDVVLFNPPYFRGTPREPLDYAWRSNDAVERFAAGLRDHLAGSGRALIVLSSDGDSQTFLSTFRANGLRVSTVTRRELLNETLKVYRLSPEE